MAKHAQHKPQEGTRSRPVASEKASPSTPHASDLARYGAAGDEPLSIAATLKMDESFRFDRGISKRLRLREVNAKEAVTIRDGSGVYFRASVQEYDARGGRAIAYERMTRSPEPAIDITLACAVLARQRMQWVMQKATELGVRRIVPLLTDHSVQRDAIEHEQPHAWAGHIARAARQCRRSSLPHLLEPTTLEAALASPLFASSDVRLFLDDRSAPGPLPAEPPRRVVLLVGPEGGFSDAERQHLARSAQPWVLGGRVLRAETAVLAALAAVQMMWGDFKTVV